jgi:tellurite methyltransferase
MSREDAARWNARYQADPRASFEKPRSFLVEHAHLLPSTGLAVDVAMGLGGNAKFLLERGLRVIGVDISIVAIRNAAKHNPGLMPVVADLPDFYLPPAAFDVIINFLFLDRELWRSFSSALRPGGILIVEALTHDMLSIHPDIDARYLLESGELAQAFPGLQTLVYHEGWQDYGTNHPRAVASILAQRQP